VKKSFKGKNLIKHAGFPFIAYHARFRISAMQDVKVHRAGHCSQSRPQAIERRRLIVEKHK